MENSEFVLYIKRGHRNLEEVVRIEQKLMEDKRSYNVVELIPEKSKFTLLPQLATPLGSFLDYDSYREEEKSQEEKNRKNEKE